MNKLFCSRNLTRVSARVFRSEVEVLCSSFGGKLDGVPAYNPMTDTNPLSANTDSDAYADGIDPVPLNYNFDDGDVAPWGTPDGKVNVADMLVFTQLILGLKTPTADDLAHGDLYPVGMPDGVIGTPDYMQLLKLIFE